MLAMKVIFPTAAGISITTQIRVVAAHETLSNSREFVVEDPWSPDSPDIPRMMTQTREIARSLQMMIHGKILLLEILPNPLHLPQFSLKKGIVVVIVLPVESLMQAPPQVTQMRVVKCRLLSNLSGGS